MYIVLFNIEGIIYLMFFMLCIFLDNVNFCGDILILVFFVFRLFEVLLVFMEISFMEKGIGIFG